MVSTLITATSPPNWTLKLTNPPTLDIDNCCWELFHHTLDERGRGLRATRDLPVHTLIFRESPLVHAPIVSARNVCVICYRRPPQIDQQHNSSSSLCRSQCGLTVCSPNCAAEHRSECNLIRSWWSPHQPLDSRVNSPNIEVLLVILPAIRALFLDDAESRLLDAMQANDYHRQETRRCAVDAAAAMFGNLPAATRERLKHIVAVLDTNAFETVVPLRSTDGDDENDDFTPPKTVSLKALFALGGQLNHECTPNTRHAADTRGRMAVHAARPIRRGEEITTTYTSLVWNRQARRAHLWLTKRFWCRCERCSSVKDADLAALRCRQCDVGRLMPPMNDDEGGEGRCDGCGFAMDHERMGQTQQIAAGILARIEDPEQLAEALQSHPIVRRLVWPSNALLVEAKLRVIWKTESPLKPQFCEHILDILRQLNAGECTLSGLLMYELWRCRRKDAAADDLHADADGLFDGARRILSGNSIAPQCMR